MPDRTRFDAVGWFASACTALLLGVVALVVAVHLVQAIWPWLLGILLVSAALGLLVRVVTAWRRRQSW